MGLHTVIDCPICKTSGARKFLWMIKCPRRGCPKYNRQLDEHLRELDQAKRHRASRKARRAAAKPVSNAAQPQVSKREPVEAPPLRLELLHPGMNAVHIRYINHAGEDRTYTADGTSVRDRGLFISACLAPTGRRCTFRKKQVQNMDEIETHIDPVTLLTPTERQIYGYHRKHGTTSPRYEEIQQKLSAR